MKENRIFKFYIDCSLFLIGVQSKIVTPYHLVLEIIGFLESEVKGHYPFRENKTKNVMVENKQKKKKGKKLAAGTNMLPILPVHSLVL